MKILVTAATEAEIALSIKHIASLGKEVKPLVFEQNGHIVAFAVTGVGMVATAYHLTRILHAEQYDMVLQAGIAGTFDRDIAIGEVQAVRSDRLADMGAEDGDSFIDVFGLGLIGPDDQPFTQKWLVNPYRMDDLGVQLKAVDAITVNTVTGNNTSVERLGNQYPGMLESMEGAAFHYVCLCEKVKFVQVRAVSNYIERRNKAAWNIELALTHLNEYLVRYITEKTAV